MRVKTLNDLKMVREKGLRSIYPDKTKITVGMATCGMATGSKEVLDAVIEEVERQRLDVVIAKTGCIGFCQREPIVDILQKDMPRIIYKEMTPEKAEELIQELAKGNVKKEWALCKMIENKVKKDVEDIPLYEELDFYKKQQKIALRNCGFIDPENIEEYIARGGYFTLYEVLTEMSPEEVIAEVTKSGLRGRGGAGFPTGVKWNFTRDAKGDIKYIICNADEGDPGAYMDRSVLEGDPHSVIEGMVIGGYAIGSSQGYVYVRDEYPQAIEKLKIAIEQAKEYGLLGKNIFDSGFNFSIKMNTGAGAFVCGEETALMVSVEGRIGEPRPRPPFPAQKGLWDSPTNINNVETWANVPVIIDKGAEWYSKIGTEKSKGTKVFSVVGKINNTGLVEVPMGTTLQEIIYDIGGGIPGDKKFKAVQTGGPSGGCIPIDLINLPIDYEQLTEVGAIMGSGGMIVMDENNCIVDIAKYFLDFLKEESCGKCVACREGIERMLEMLTDICEGKGKKGDIELLEELATVVKDFSLCALGGTAPNPVLTTIKYFRDEYKAHIKYKRCPAAVCKKIISSPCQHTCPLNTDVPAYVTLIAKGQFKEAIDLIRKTNPLPNICARVCHHPCEDKCASGDGGDPTAIKALKRFAADYELRVSIKPEFKPERPKYEKVAVIGSGPSGLTCAHDLAKLGYEVTVFEALPVAGGMLAVGIPEYRLPKKMLNIDIDYIKSCGVTIKTNVAVGKDVGLDDLFKQGYKAIFIAVGAHKSLKLGIPGEDIEGVLDSLKFLKAVNLGEEVKIGDRVAVIGGGNAAIDAARTALRMGCKEVSIIYRRTKAEMPALKEEVEEAIHEGIDIKFLAAPVRVLSENGKLGGIECIRMKLGEFDKSGRRRPIPIEGSEFIIDLDTLIPAIGQQPDLSFLPENNRFGISKGNTFVVDPETLATNQPGVFAGGDAVTGPATVTQAMAAGKIVASSIHKYLRGESLSRKYEVTKPSIYVKPIMLTDEEIEELKRPEMPCLPLEKRAGNFEEVELGFTEEMAIMEGKRCLRCDIQT